MLSTALADALHETARFPDKVLAAPRVELLRGSLDFGEWISAAWAPATHDGGLAPRTPWDWGVTAVTDDAFVDDRLLAKLEAAVDGGVSAIQLRLKHATAADYLM